MKYTKKQIQNTIRHWQKVLESYDNKIVNETMSNYPGSYLKKKRITTLHKLFKLIDDYVDDTGEVNVEDYCYEDLTYFGYDTKTNTVMILDSSWDAKLLKDKTIVCRAPNWKKIQTVKDLKLALEAMVYLAKKDFKLQDLKTVKFECGNHIQISFYPNSTEGTLYIVSRTPYEDPAWDNDLG